MLRYLGKGLRYYQALPVAVFPRPAWEIQAILSGDARPILLSGPAVTEPVAPRLWVFPPPFAHGWGAPSAEASEVAVMHFDKVPEQLRLAAGKEPISVALTDEEAAKIRDLADFMWSHYEQPTWLSDLHADAALLTLAFIALKQQHGRPLNRMQDLAGQTVDRALAWYSEHLSQQPDVTDLAQSVAMSESHLRRLFRRVRGHGPLEAMHQMQIERAKHLMRSSTLSLKEIAVQCGYSGPTVFSRAFSQDQGISPQEWRREELSQ